jgi:4-hydroxyphenylpyruvate dioxygenase-like putative hemolysin
MTPNALFKRITQVALVVKSVEATAKRCWENFGMGPWTFYTFDPSKVEGMTVHGRRVDHAMRTGHATIGDIDWEIIEPLDDRSIYAEHLRKHGEGLHHVLFDVEDYVQAQAQIIRTGGAEITSGNWFGHPYSYFDTQNSLGCIAEIWSPPAAATELPPVEGTYP